MPAKTTKALPVYPLHQDENFLPGPVGSRLPVNDGVSEQLLQTLHVYDTHVFVNTITSDVLDLIKEVDAHS